MTLAKLRKQETHKKLKMKSHNELHINTTSVCPETEWNDTSQL